MSVNHFELVNPIEVKMHASQHGSLYEAIVSVGLRARQINDQIRNQYLARVADLAESEEENVTNFDKLQISREFDKIHKPTFLAMREMLDGELRWWYSTGSQQQ
ncbi:MAG: DNA-directed RNA polymerase subunit omega [Chlorobi bacterium]|nr:DNA-directed RNA polymerase subunit omega [Chlorobiota bacterium]